MVNCKSVVLGLKMFGVCMLLSAVVMACYMTNFYRSDSVVYAVGTKTILIESGEDLFEWELEDGEEYKVGDHVILKMSTGGTDDTRADDAILSITKVK